MRSIPHPVFAHAVLIGVSLILVGCGASDRAVAESLAADVRALQADAARTALIEADCAQMRLEVEVLQRRPEAETAGTQIEIESLQNRISQNCR